MEAIRALRIARDGAVKARTAALNQLKDLITTAPDPLRAGLRGKTLRAPEPPEGRGQPRGVIEAGSRRASPLQGKECRHDVPGTLD